MKMFYRWLANKLYPYLAGKQGWVGPTGPMGIQGPQGIQGRDGECKCKCHDWNGSTGSTGSTGSQQCNVD